jgi:hypothetical protein
MGHKAERNLTPKILPNNKKTTQLHKLLFIALILFGEQFFSILQRNPLNFTVELKSNT